MQNASNTNNIGIIVCSKECCCIEVNSIFTSMVGKEAVSVQGKPLYALTHPDDYREEEESLSALFAGKVDSYFQEKRFIKSDGSIVWAQVHVAALRDGDTLPDRCTMMIYDISMNRVDRLIRQTRMTAMELLYRKETLDEILLAIVRTIETYDAGMFVSILTLKDGRLYKAAAPSLPDDFCKSIEGMRIGDGVGSCGTAAYRKETVVAEDIYDHPYWRRARNLIEDYPMRSCWSEPIMSSDGKVLGTFAIYYCVPKKPNQFELDLIKSASELISLILEFTRSREVTIQARRAAEKANHAKDSFIATMSHEIRTPLNGILGTLQLLKMTSLNSEQEEYVEVANVSGGGLLRVVNDILDYSKIEAGAVSIEPRPTSLLSVAKEIKRHFKKSTEEQGVLIVFGIASELPETIYLDSGRLRQILINLIGNSLKFTQQGVISISIQKDDQYLSISVEDNGVGIPAEKLEMLFEPFTQADGSYARAHQGTGLGLSIVKRLVELMGGKISIQSEPNIGTKVCFSLKYSETGDVLTLHKSQRVNSQVRSKNILLVDDNRVNMLVASRILQKMGHTILEAQSGKEALVLADEHDYDLVLMDIQMPGMDGIEATRLLRDHSRYGEKSKVPFVAMTAHSMADEQEAFHAEGMLYLSKPFSIEEMKRLIDTV